MPPLAMPFRVLVTMRSARRSWPTWAWASSAARLPQGGNLGAPPKPPSARSQVFERASETASSQDPPSSPTGLGRRPVEWRCWRTSSLIASTWGRWSRQSPATWWRTWVNDGMPCRGLGGK